MAHDGCNWTCPECHCHELICKVCVGCKLSGCTVRSHTVCWQCWYDKYRDKNALRTHQNALGSTIGTGK